MKRKKETRTTAASTRQCLPNASLVRACAVHVNNYGLIQNVLYAWPSQMARNRIGEKTAAPRKMRNEKEKQFNIPNRRRGEISTSFHCFRSQFLEREIFYSVHYRTTEYFSFKYLFFSFSSSFVVVAHILI